MNKRGQFFIVAAMIVVSVMAGLSGVVNYARASEGDEKVYDLSKEIDFETKRVVDWGVFNREELNQLTTGFLDKYSEYIGEDDAIFIFGDENELNALHFTLEGVGSVGLDTNENGPPKKIEINRRTKEEAEISLSQGRRSGERKVSVIIDGSQYSFNLKDEQENFFFIIKKVKGDEEYVVSR